MIKKSPITFHPYLKTVIWGGNKICKFKGIPQTTDNIGESWEISEIPGHESIVAEGVYAGMTLTELIQQYGPEILGNRVYEKYNGKFPLLVKLIDANDNLSMQVHPDDKLAKERHNCFGKSEMWYIISSQENAKIYSGFRSQTNPEEYEKKIAEGSFIDSVASHESNPGDVYFLPAGIIHAIGAGNFLVEIQESSDITYRIYDYNRNDINGRKRDLHIEQARDAIDCSLYPSYIEHSEVVSDSITPLMSCNHFQTYQIIVTKELNLSLSQDSFTILMCVEGNVILKYPSGEYPMRRGLTVLLPAIMTDIVINGEGKLLMAHS